MRAMKAKSVRQDGLDMSRQVSRREVPMGAVALGSLPSAPLQDRPAAGARLVSNDAAPAMTFTSSRPPATGTDGCR